MTERSVLEHVLAGRDSAERIRRRQMYGYIASSAERAEARKADRDRKQEGQAHRRRERTERRRQARLSGERRPAKREYLLSKYGCVWPGCQELQARYANAYREPVQALPEYGNVPLCGEHIHQTWAAAEDIAEGRRELEQLNELCEAVDLDEPVEFDWRPTGRVDRKPRPQQHGSIYYLRCDGFIKIGYARDLSKRMKQYPPTIELLAARPGTQAEEAAEHSLLQEHRAWRREWYHPTEAVLRHLEEVMDIWGAPLPTHVRATESESSSASPCL